MKYHWTYHKMQSMPSRGGKRRLKNGLRGLAVVMMQLMVQVTMAIHKAQAGRRLADLRSIRHWREINCPTGLYSALNIGLVGRANWIKKGRQNRRRQLEKEEKKRKREEEAAKKAQDKAKMLKSSTWLPLF